VDDSCAWPYHSEYWRHAGYGSSAWYQSAHPVYGSDDSGLWNHESVCGTEYSEYIQKRLKNHKGVFDLWESQMNLKRQH